MEEQTQTSAGERVLIVEDDPPTRSGLAELVQAWGFQTDEAPDGEEALRRVTTFRPAIIVSDLVRHPLAYHGIRLLTRLCTRNAMTRTDAPLSVARAFTLAEWRELLRRADIGSFELSMTFPFRMLAVVSLGN